MDSPSSSPDVLPAFQIRDLHANYVGETTGWRSSDLDLCPKLEQNSSSHGTVQLRAQEYDNALSKCQIAALRYVDEDDGEVVQVGQHLH